MNSNSLVIVGPMEKVKSVTELVRQLDVKGETEGGVDIRIYKLENGEVKSVGQTLEDMIERVLNLMPGTESDRSRRRFSVRVWGDEPTKTLFVLVPPRSPWSKDYSQCLTKIGRGTSTGRVKILSC